MMIYFNCFSEKTGNGKRVTAAEALREVFEI